MENKQTQWRFLRVPSEHIDSTGSVTEGCLPGFGINAFRTCVPPLAVQGCVRLGILYLDFEIPFLEFCSKTRNPKMNFNARLQNSPHFCVFKYARAVKQKVWNEAENREACEARALGARKTLTPRFTDFFTDFEKKPDCFAVYFNAKNPFLRWNPIKKSKYEFHFHFIFIHHVLGNPKKEICRCRWDRCSFLRTVFKSFSSIPPKKKREKMEIQRRISRR